MEDTYRDIYRRVRILQGLRVQLLEKNLHEDCIKVQVSLRPRTDQQVRILARQVYKTGSPERLLVVLLASALFTR